MTIESDINFNVNNLFLFGAGFTNAINNAPLNNELLSSLINYCSDPFLAKYRDEFNTDNIELLLTYLDIQIQQNVKDINRQEKLREDRKKIEGVLVNYLTQFNFPQNPESLLQTKCWIESFAKNTFRKNDVIISLNYDCLLEGILDHFEAWSPRNGYVGIPHFFEDEMPINSKNIRFSKIHGSVNFIKSGTIPHREQTAISYSINASLYPRSGQNRHFGGGIIKPENYIIAPSFIKIPHIEISNMMIKTLDFAQKAKNLIIGGCGLRSEDSFLQLLLVAFLNRPTHSPKRKLIIIDLNAQAILEKIEQNWPGKLENIVETILIEDGFCKKAIDQLNKNLQDSTMNDDNSNNDTNQNERLDFVRQIVADDTDSGKWDGRVATRFPPEPNGYLHIGHAKSICLNFGIAREFAGTCNLRFDDTNPCKEEQEYVDSIIEDVRWLGGDFGDKPLFGSDYFQQMYDWAVDLVKKGKAYVCDLTAEETRQYRGTLTEPGKNSPYRDRSVEENLDLFERMKAGEFPDGSKTLKAKIDMASPNVNMRDPVMYRILHAAHHRTDDTWCVYPMYDWAHGLEDSIEGITHSICTLEFENHRPLYDWFLDALDIHHPQQIEFARLNLTYTVMSKRKLLQLVKEGHVSGWDDPRMPTICGLRRRGFSPEAIRNFCKLIGVNKFNSTIDFALLEHCLRDHLNKTSPRVMAVLNPLKVVITNYPDSQSEELDAVNNPEDPTAGTRKVPFSKVLYIEQEDFMEEPPKKFFRLAPGREVRLRYAYFVTCNEIVKDDNGKIVELRCTYDPETRGGDAPDGRKVKATLHWVSAEHALNAEVRLYDHLFNKENPDEVEEGKTFLGNMNPDSLNILDNCKIEPSVKGAKALDRWQFERIGYFCTDKDSSDEKPVFNKTVGLKDTWAKIQNQEKKR